MMRQAWRRDRKRCLFRHAFRFRESKLSTRPSCMGFPSVMSREATFRSFDHFRIALRQCRSVFPDQKAAIASRSGDAIKFVATNLIASPDREAMAAFWSGKTERHWRNAILKWSKDRKVASRDITLGKPMQDGRVESFDSRKRKACLNKHLFLSLRQACRIIAAWRAD